MTLLNHWLRQLDASGIRYSHSTHRPAHTALGVADAERVQPHEIIKTVIYHGAGFGIALVPADKLVDLPEVAHLLGLSSVRLASEDELEDIFPGYEPGAMPPFGNFGDFPILVDEEVAQREFIAFTAGTHRDVIRMSFSDFRNLARPRIGPIAVWEKELV